MPVQRKTRRLRPSQTNGVLPRRAAVFAVILAAVTIAGCGSSNSTSTSGGSSTGASSSSGSGGSNVKIGLISSDVNTDNSWGTAHYRGIQAAASSLGGAHYAVAQSAVSPQQVYAAGVAFGSQGYKMVAVANGSVASTIVELAKKYPKTFWCELASPIPNAPSNVCTYNVTFQDGTFVAGALAGMLTKTNHVAVVVGLNFPLLVSEAEGFVLGARWVNPKVQSSEPVINSLTDVTAGETAANAAIGAGADFILNAADSAIVGQAKAAEAHPHTYVISQYYNDAFLAPKVILTTAPEGLTNATATVLERGARGQLKNQAYNFGGAATLAPFGQLSSAVPASVAARVAKIEVMVRSGKVTVPFLGKLGQGQQYPLSKLPAPPN